MCNICLLSEPLRFAEQWNQGNAVNCLEAKDVELREAIDGVRKWRVEQYNELVSRIVAVTQELNFEKSRAASQDRAMHWQ